MQEYAKQPAHRPTWLGQSLKVNSHELLCHAEPATLFWQHFYMLDALPVTQPTASNALKTHLRVIKYFSAKK